MKKRGQIPFFSTKMVMSMLALAIIFIVVWPKLAIAKDTLFDLLGLNEKCAASQMTKAGYQKLINDLLKKTKLDPKIEETCAEFRQCFPKEKLWADSIRLFANKIKNIPEIVIYPYTKRYQTTHTFVLYKVIDGATDNVEAVRKVYETYKKCSSEELSPEITFKVANAYFQYTQCELSWGADSERIKDNHFWTRQQELKESARLYDYILYSDDSKFIASVKDKIDLRLASIYSDSGRSEADNPGSKTATYLKNVLSKTKGKAPNALSEDERSAARLIDYMILPIDFGWEYEDMIEGTDADYKQFIMDGCEKSYFNSDYNDYNQDLKDKLYWGSNKFIEECCKTTSIYSCKIAKEFMEKYKKFLPKKGYFDLSDSGEKNEVEMWYKNSWKLATCTSKVSFILGNNYDDYYSAVSSLKNTFYDNCLFHEGLCQLQGNSDNLINGIYCGSDVMHCYSKTNIATKVSGEIKGQAEIQEAKKLYEEMIKKLKEKGLGYLIDNLKTEEERNAEKWALNPCGQMGGTCVNKDSNCPQGKTKDPNIKCPEDKECCRNVIEAFAKDPCPAYLNCIQSSGCKEENKMESYKCNDEGKVCCNPNNICFRGNPYGTPDQNRQECDCDADGDIDGNDCDGKERLYCYDLDSTEKEEFKCFDAGKEPNIISCKVSTSVKDEKNTEPCDCNGDGTYDSGSEIYYSKHYTEDCGQIGIFKEGSTFWSKKMSMYYCLDSKCYEEPLCGESTKNNCRCHGNDGNFELCNEKQTCENGKCSEGDCTKDNCDTNGNCQKDKGLCEGVGCYYENSKCYKIKTIKGTKTFNIGPYGHSMLKDDEGYSSLEFKFDSYAKGKVIKSMFSAPAFDKGGLVKVNDVIDTIKIGWDNSQNKPSIPEKWAHFTMARTSSFIKTIILKRTGNPGNLTADLLECGYDKEKDMFIAGKTVNSILIDEKTIPNSSMKAVELWFHMATNSGEYYSGDYCIRLQLYDVSKGNKDFRYYYYYEDHNYYEWMRVPASTIRGDYEQRRGVYFITPQVNNFYASVMLKKVGSPGDLQAFLMNCNYDENDPKFINLNIKKQIVINEKLITNTGKWIDLDFGINLNAGEYCIILQSTKDIDNNYYEWLGSSTPTWGGEIGSKTIWMEYKENGNPKITWREYSIPVSLSIKTAKTEPTQIKIGIEDSVTKVSQFSQDGKLEIKTSKEFEYDPSSPSGNPNKLGYIVVGPKNHIIELGYEIQYISTNPLDPPNNLKS